MFLKQKDVHFTLVIESMENFCFVAQRKNLRLLILQQAKDTSTTPKEKMRPTQCIWSNVRDYGQTKRTPDNMCSKTVITPTKSPFHCKKLWYIIMDRWISLQSTWTTYRFFSCHPTIAQIEIDCLDLSNHWLQILIQKWMPIQNCQTKYLKWNCSTFWQRHPIFVKINQIWTIFRYCENSIIEQIRGGIWVDSDVIFLRDLRRNCGNVRRFRAKFLDSKSVFAQSCSSEDWIDVDKGSCHGNNVAIVSKSLSPQFWL